MAGLGLHLNLNQVEQNNVANNNNAYNGNIVMNPQLYERVFYPDIHVGESYYVQEGIQRPILCQVEEITTDQAGRITISDNEGRDYRIGTQQTQHQSRIAFYRRRIGGNTSTSKKGNPESNMRGKQAIPVINEDPSPLVVGGRRKRSQRKRKQYRKRKHTRKNYN